MLFKVLADSHEPLAMLFKVLAASLEVLAMLHQVLAISHEPLAMEAIYLFNSDWLLRFGSTNQFSPEALYMHLNYLNNLLQISEHLSWIIPILNHLTISQYQVFNSLHIES